MEVYFKDLISREASLEKLVDHLMRVVQGVQDLAEASGANLEAGGQELAGRLAQLKEACEGLKERAQRAAVSMDKTMRAHPYVSLSLAFGCGLAIGFLAARSWEEHFGPNEE